MKLTTKLKNMNTIKQINDPSPTPFNEIIDYYDKLNLDVRKLEQEDRLDLDLIPLIPEVAEPEIDECDTYLKVSTGRLEKEIIRINRVAFVGLFKIATEMRSGTESYLTGLKIHFGLVGRKIEPIFQPVYMKRVAAGQGTNDYSTQFELHYVYNSGMKQFDKAEEEDLRKIDNYKSAIQIKHDAASAHGPFSEGDVEGVIFPFQTIFSLLYYNEGDHDVFFYNAIRSVGSKKKHCILLATKEKPFPQPVFENKYANRSHLCPPCRRVSNSIFVESQAKV
ncbi:hypothetical protein D3C87_05600 [compost metagenome]